MTDCQNANVRMVATAFLQRSDGKVLILRRSQKVGSYRGMWAGISGHVEPDETPLDTAIKEIGEETGIRGNSIQFIREGGEMKVIDCSSGITWLVHSFLFSTSTTEVALDWEHDEHKWIDPATITDYETVEKLRDGMRSVGLI